MINVKWQSDHFRRRRRSPILRSCELRSKKCVAETFITILKINIDAHIMKIIVTDIEKFRTSHYFS